MIVKLCDNLIVNIDDISHFYNGKLYLKSGSVFNLNDIGLSNLEKIAKEHEDLLFKNNDE
ncbi:hypothetical protein AVV48_gp73 [Acinetobacter phage phiAC-1]|uniref:hypothetical protein n=1 Tax=Acinetobacter phage phiAC-1 TaxID=1229760 RepID=UPI00028A66C0|nr:hypothetical protein AVV48_gp73 [Acinetobacter phage phiAC-1]AFU62322.1 hypothetical protein phiAC-1_0073 [Acinetobacter phage phiAC-1]